MYRTDKIYLKTQDKPCPPVCIVSYSRPNSSFTKWLLSDKFDVPKESVFMFIRNAPEERKAYKYLKERLNLVMLPDYVKELGLTRQAVLDWAIENEYKTIFMLDDRVNGIWYLTPTERPSGTCMDVSKSSTPCAAFKIWAKEHNHAGFVLSGCSSKGFHWSPDFINAPLEPLNGGFPSVCVCLSPMKLAEFDVTYQSTEIYGAEDVDMLYQCFINRLPVGMLHDIAFDQSKPIDIGGDSKIHPGMSRDERLLKVKKTFWSARLGLPWGEKHPGFRVVNRKNESSCIYPNYKYWRKYYEDTK